MSKLHFTFKDSEVCPDNLRYSHVDGHVSISSDKASWYAKILKHEADNGRTLPETWKEDAQDQLCRILPPGWCAYGNGEIPKTYVNVRMDRDTFLRGMEVLTRIALSSDPLVPQELAESRAKICAACPANILIEGCAPCLNAVGLVANIKGAAKTESEPLLKACAACGCSNRAQVHIRPELLAKGVGEKQMEQLRTVPWCWKHKEIDALQN